jgi:hypothetical protein
MISINPIHTYVQESEEENQYIAPVVRAVQNHLETEERMYIKRNKNIVGRERTYHHMGPTTYNRRWKTLTLNDTWILHHEDTKSLSNWEKVNNERRPLTKKQIKPTKGFHN